MAKNNWIQIWVDDKTSMIRTMRSNLASDINAGYCLSGKSVRRQMVIIEEYEYEFERQMDAMKGMTVAQAKHWCYTDLKKRGAIL